MQRQDDFTQYEAANADALARDAHVMRQVYYAIGRDDFLFRTSAPTRVMLDRHGIRYVYNESDGGHTWINWRRHFYDFALRLFR